MTGARPAEADLASVAAAPLVGVRSLICRLGRTTALYRVNFDLAPGEKVAVLGPNGSGKTTLLRAVAGLVAPQTGSVRIAGRLMSESGSRARALVGFVGHNPHHYLDLTLKENLDFVADLYGLPDAGRRLEQLLKAVSLWPYRDRRARELSRGMQRRLSLAAALLPSPRVLLLDEPEAALDDASRSNLGEVISAFAPQAGLMIATHDLPIASTLARRALLLDRGRLVWDGSFTGADLEYPPWKRDAALSGRPVPITGATPTPPTLPGIASRVEEEAAVSWRVSTRQALAIVRKDLRVELRSREVVAALAVLAALMLVAFSLAFVISPEDAPAVAAGALWSSLVLANAVGVQRGFAAEWDRGTVDALLLAPVSRIAIYMAKTGVNMLFLFVVASITAAGAGMLFSVPLLRWDMPLLLVLGSAALASVGSLYGAVAGNLRARELLVPVLLLPVSLPALIAGVAATLAVLGVTGEGLSFPWLGLLAAFCAIFLTVSALLFEYVFGE